MLVSIFCIFGRGQNVCCLNSWTPCIQLCKAISVILLNNFDNLLIAQLPLTQLNCLKFLKKHEICDITKDDVYGQHRGNKSALLLQIYTVNHTFGSNFLNLVFQD